MNISLRGKYHIEGSPVTMACESSGKPLPDVAWIRNGVLESSGKKVTFLKIDNINRADAGQYTCRANNSVEVTSIDTSIVVQCKYILTLIFYFWIYFVYGANPVIGVSYPGLANLFKSERQQNSTSSPCRLFIHWSQLLVFDNWICVESLLMLFYFEGCDIFCHITASVGLCLTQEMA